MATNSRPTTEYHVTYGTLSTVSSERTLTPVIIAPNYKIHSYKEGYADSFLSEYNGKEVTCAWPGKTDNAVVDSASSVVYAKRPLVQLNTEGIKGTVSSTRVNSITVTNSLQTIDKDTVLEEALQGFSVQVGDKVKVIQNGKTTLATVTGLGSSADSGYTQAAVSQPTPLTATTKADIDAAGKFTGSANATYLVKVLTTPADSASAVRMQVIALTGDQGYASTFNVGKSPVTIGNYGVTIALPASVEMTSYQQGDCWSIACTAKATKAYNVIYVNTELSAESAELFFCSNRYSNDYVKVSAGVVLNNAGITLPDELRITVNNISCPIVEAAMYVEYRELVKDNALQLVASWDNNIADFVGVADPRNPLGFLSAACSGVADAAYYLLATDGDDEAAYIRAINYAAQFEEVYSFVTWEDTPAIYAAKASAVSKYSNPLIAQFKKTWYAPYLTNEEVIYDADSKGNALLASIGADGVVTLASPGNAITGGVAPGDYMLVYNSVDSTTGEWTTNKYKVTEVTDADTMTIADGDITDISRVSFVRELSNYEYAKKIASMAAAINDERTNLVWCSGDVNFNGFSAVKPTVAAAILATTRGATAPHAPLTGLPVSGVQLVDKLKFTDVEYEILNAGGVWVVANNSQGVAVNYHQITTKTDGTVAEEDSCVSAGDAVVREIRNAVAPLTAGSVNVSDALISDIKVQLVATMGVIMGRAYPSSYGPLVEGYDILKLERPEANNAAIMLKMDIDTPQPLLKGQVYCNII